MAQLNGWYTKLRQIWKWLIRALNWSMRAKNVCTFATATRCNLWQLIFGKWILQNLFLKKIRKYNSYNFFGSRLDYIWFLISHIFFQNLKVLLFPPTWKTKVLQRHLNTRYYSYVSWCLYLSTVGFCVSDTFLLKQEVNYVECFSKQWRD